MTDEENLLDDAATPAANYTEDDIVTLDWNVHIRERPGMYIGKLGDGSNADDGIYVLLKEVLDNTIDEYMMGFGKQVDVTVTESSVTVRDFGRGIPLGKMTDAVSKINTGAKYDTKAFKKSIGLNGVGVKAVNALSCDFMVQSVREGKMKQARFSGGNIISETPVTDTDQPNGTLVEFTPDPKIFTDYRYRDDFIIPLLKNYT